MIGGCGRGLLGIVVLTLAACASVPDEAPELSAALGERLAALERSHRSLLAHYFDTRRAAVDRFVSEQWVPLFARNLFEQPAVAAAWKTIVRENDPEARLEFIVRLGPRLQRQIDAKRQEFIAPLDALERTLADAIGSEYAEARAINNAITSYLVSATEVESNRTRLLEALGLGQDRYGPVIGAVDEAVADLLRGAQDIEERSAQGRAYLQKLRDARERLEQVSSRDGT